MNIRFDRLKMIAEDVRRAPRDKFNIELYYNPCNSVACALGHHILAHPESELTWDGLVCAPGPMYRGARGIDAVTGYLGIEVEDAMWLFWRQRYPFDRQADREFVANRIEQFIRDHREPEFIELKADATATVPVVRVPILEPIGGIK